jgi:aryl-alcohol dehydrogenase-like predicted oxidoreductase
MTLGTAQLGFDYGIANINGKPDNQISKAILQAAIDSGINCFDTAPAYGDSENIIGNFLVQYPNFIEPPLIISKLSAIAFTDTVTANSIYSHIKQQVLQSIKYLRLTRIPIYMLHRAGDVNLFNGQIITSLLKLKEENLIGLVGISVYHPEEVEQVLTID